MNDTSDDALTDAEHFAALRQWAAGTNTVAAATELLIRTGFAQKWRPWVRSDELARRPWIAFDEIPELIGGMSGGETRLLSIAASLGGTTPIILGDDVAGLDRGWTELVAAAIVHAAGFTEPTRGFSLEGDTPQLVDVPPLMRWPAES